MDNQTITAIPGVRVGHYTDKELFTGLTLVDFDKPVLASYKAIGGAVASVNTTSLQNGSYDHWVNGMFITGGSTFGLGNLTSLQQKYVQNARGFKSHSFINPNLVGAVVFDLSTRRGNVSHSMGQKAYEHLSSNPVEEGNVGAGTGTHVGKFWYPDLQTMASMKSGVGSFAMKLPGSEIIVGALSVVNALGNIVKDGQVIAGNRGANIDEKFVDFSKRSAYELQQSASNTTITILGTNLDLQTREQTEKFAHFGTLGQVRAITPVNLSRDGDTVFSFSTQEIKASGTDDINSWENFTFDMLGHHAATVVQESIYRACYSAETIDWPDALGGFIPSANDYK